MQKFENFYLQTNNLLINFNNDNLDQSKRLLNCLNQRNFDSSKLIELKGNHLTPASTGFRKEFLGHWAEDRYKSKDLNKLIETIFDWSQQKIF